MRCALCLSDEALKNSHIIPEFLYRSVYDEKHRLHQISADPNERNLYLQKGLREPLLCGQCEQRFSPWERYVSLLLNGGVDVGVQQEGKRLHLSKLDYSKLKLFQLSVLWRAGVSKLPAFSQVELGPHEERIRKMLLSNEPGSTETYGCLMFILMNEHELVRDLVVPPTWARLDGRKAYRFILGGLVFLYVVANHATPRFITDHYLQQDGAAIIKLQQMQELRFLMDWVAKVHNLGKLDL